MKKKESTKPNTVKVYLSCSQKKKLKKYCTKHKMSMSGFLRNLVDHIHV